LTSQRQLFATRLLVVALFAVASGRPVAAQFAPAAGTGPGLAETIEAIDAARVTTRILYITAHPDDESAAVLTYLARGLHADVALLSLTHGEGGQNALGPEQAPQLGLIRTQELLAATRGYGVKLYFTRARDFGFSKTPEESQKIWGDQVQEDMVRVIRSFRPNVVINHWGGVHSGHGHHQASGLLTPKAVAAARETSFCPDCGQIWNVEQILDVDRSSDHPSGYVLPLDEVSPLWGKTWREIGIDAFANHKTQGVSVFLGSPFIRRPVRLVPEDATLFDPTSLARPLHTLARDSSGDDCMPSASDCPLLKNSENQIIEAERAALILDWEKSSAALEGAIQDFRKIYVRGDSTNKNKLMLDGISEALLRVNRALALVNGVEIDAASDRAAVVAGETFEVTVAMRCRVKSSCAHSEPTLVLPAGWSATRKDGSADRGIHYTVLAGPLPARNVLQWLQLSPDELVSAQAAVNAGNYSFEVRRAVTHIESTTVHLERVPVRVVPAYSLEVQPKQAVEVQGDRKKPLEVFLHVHSHSARPAKIQIGVAVPKDWTAGPEIPVEFSGSDDKYVKLIVTPPANLATGNYTITAYAKRGGETFTTSVEPLATAPTLLWSEPAECQVHVFAIKVPGNLHIGYISAENEPIPEALRNLGISVEMLDANALNFGDLSKFSAVVVGIRAYEIRSDLPGANQRLLNYVENGGTLLVQYQRDFAWDHSSFAPYPATISGTAENSLARITDETAEVKFLKADDPLLNEPNKITPADFQGWIQERGLYFWTHFDDKYTPLLAMHDPHEKDLNGGLVYTHLGQGTYIYTGLAFFRQLPEGVPGAYRLFINLLSASRTK
jgi:LmbE family N-acetylglucosaminyl deacetylase